MVIRFCRALCHGLVAACLLPAAAPVTGQQQEPPRFQEEVEVSEVLIDVLVRDSDGRVIVGLSADDFVVLEDGEPVELASVSFYSDRQLLASDPAAAGGGEIDPRPQERTFLWFVQDQRRNSARLLARQLEAGRAAAAWIRDGLGPRDRGAVLSYDVKLELHQDLTGDREALARAVERATQGRSADGNWPSRRPPADDGPSLSRALPSGKELRRASGTPYEALTTLARAARQVPGRKILVFFGLGFGRVDERGGYEREPLRVEPMLEALNDANVAVYPVEMTESGVRHTFENALAELASRTGGEYLRRFVNFAAPLRRIAEINSGFYLLSYRSPHPVGSRGFQQVEVRTVNPSFRINARRGYLYGAQSSR